MPSWTKEQQEAIDKEGTNIIVSAGAGSGKTAVLTARTIRKLKDGVNINQILILTFTNAAAFEMKERIRKAIGKEESLKDQLKLIDEAYITTFDSFSLSIVKKYHYLLNISKNVSICDSSIIFNEKNKILDRIMDRYYEEKNSDFIKLINDFCIKDDNDIRKYILSINDKMDLLMDKEYFLDNYDDVYFNEEFINKNIDSLNNKINVSMSLIKDNFNTLLSLCEDKYYDKVFSLYIKYQNALKYEDIYNVVNESFPGLPPKSDESVKVLKATLCEQISDLKKYLKFSSLDEIKESIYLTKPYTNTIISIVKELSNELNKFKYSNNSFEFNDIAKMAIKIVRENEEVRFYLKNFFKEIMIDEYQDTSYLQESFIKLIENDDVYMVGDIKQSIYRFRNADPSLFKNKYDNYSKNEGGYKIDLVKNFRSRDKVLNNINLIFDSIMDNEIGGAEYSLTHRMVFGNNTYINEGMTEQNYDMEIYNYSYDKSLGFTKDEIEIFTIVKDIEDKVKNHYQIFDKDSCLLRDVTYNDFCILLDRSSKFDLYKKIFEYFKIPITKYTSTNITQDNDVLLIKNILSLIICVMNKDYKEDFRYNFMSVGRSYLFRYRDQELFDYLEGDFKSSSLYEIVLSIVEVCNTLSLSKIIEVIIEKFDFYLKSISVGDMEKTNVRCEYIINLSVGMENMGFGLVEFRDYLDNLITSDIKMECEISENISDSVKIMTIHKSKGLEYHICYFAGLSYGFNIMDLNERFMFSEKYGIISPYFKEGIDDTIYKTLLRDDYILDEISEKIRLFYVALTRCKEKMIFVCDLNNEVEEREGLVVSSLKRIKYRSFLDMLKSIKDILVTYIKDINIDDLGLTSDYNLIRTSNYKDSISNDYKVINNVELNIDKSLVESKHFSKESHDLMTREVREKQDFGTYIHYLFEVFDFKNPDYSGIDEKYHKYLNNFLNSGLDFNCNIYKEYEFMYEEDNSILHGIIDLMLEYEDSIKIIDYKLKNIDDENYVKQLDGYRTYIKNKTGKEVFIYLYSVINNELRCL